MSSPSHVDASVAGNALIAFQNVEDDLKDATAFTLAYAQLSAIQNGTDVKTDPTGFFNSVRDLLQSLGCEPEHFNFTAYKPTGSTVQLEAVVREVLDKELPPTERDLALGALDELKASAGSSSGGSADFGSHASSPKGGGFSISVARPDFESDGVQVSLLAIAFTGTTSPDDFLGSSEPAAALAISYATNQFVVSGDVWQQEGDQIRKAIDEHAKGYIVELT